MRTLELHLMIHFQGLVTHQRDLDEALDLRWGPEVGECILHTLRTRDAPVVGRLCTGLKAMALPRLSLGGGGCSSP